MLIAMDVMLMSLHGLPTDVIKVLEDVKWM